MFILGEVFVWIFLCTICVSYEKGYFAFWSTVILAVCLWFSGLNVFTWAWANPKLLAQWIFVYILAGIVWGTFKFVVKLRKARNEYVKDKERYLKYTGCTGLAKQEERTAKTWIEQCKRGYNGSEDYAPTVNKNKENIMFWAWWWPFSIISFFFEDLIVEIWNMSWRFMKGLLDGIRTSVLGEAAKDLDE